MKLDSMLSGLQDLPTEIPIFDLSSMVLLPRAHLPIAIENEKFAQLVDDAFKKDRLVGVVQKVPQSTKHDKIFPLGCLGKITTFTESETGKSLIIVSGLTRFTIVRELKSKKNYRRMKVSYDDYTYDRIPEQHPIFERENLLLLLREYLSLFNISANWDEINAASDERLITSLTMVCPFEPREKQALLESPNLLQRCRMMTALIEKAYLKGVGATWVTH